METRKTIKSQPTANKTTEAENKPLTQDDYDKAKQAQGEIRKAIAEAKRLKKEKEDKEKEQLAKSGKQDPRKIGTLVLEE